MEKFIAMFLVLALCLCGCSTEEKLSREEIVLPAIPTQMPVQNLPTTPQDSANFDDEGTEAVDPAGETYPWETEFIEADYEFKKEEFDEGIAYCWINGYEKGRQIIYYNDGRVEDTYYYPNGSISHLYFWNADGSYSEMGFLDNSYVETKEDGSKITHMGTQVYSKTINTDGSWEETQYNSEGIAELTICQLADGSYREIRYDSKGVSVHEITRGLDGYYDEVLWYDNGQVQYTKNQTSDEEQEARYDEDGFMTYFHTKRADYEIELITDENGKLVKAIENGQTIEDPSALAQYVTSYNFRN